ncbi:hypothetical protein [Pontimicrobium sp. MEBiC06410]
MTYLEKIIIALFFMVPSIHFWTGSISKEAIIFSLMAIIFIRVNTKNVNSWILFFSVLLILFVRPYLAILLIAPLVLLYYKSFNRLSKIIIVFFIVFAIPILIRFLRIKNVDSFYENYQKIVIYAQNYGGSSINLLESNYFERLILVLFRPFFIDAKTTMQYFVSFENFIWLIMFFCIILLLKHFKEGFKYKVFKFLIIYLISIVGFYGIYMYNLGLASRMRVLFIPYTIIFLLILINIKNKKLKSLR